MAGSAEFARAVVWDHKADIYPRIDAIVALVALDDRELIDIAGSIAAGPGEWSQSAARSILYRLYPSHMTDEQLIGVLGWMEETNSTGYQLSRVLPTLVTGLPIDRLEALQAQLVPLVAQGFGFDKALYAARNERPHLVHLLAMACALLLEAGAAPRDGGYGAALSAILARSIRSDDAVPSRLGQAIANAPAAVRAEIFDQSVALHRILHPDQPRLNLSGEFARRGALHWSAEDEPWIRDRLANPTSAPDLRAAALVIEAMTFAREAPNRTAYLAEIAPLVADDAELSADLAARCELYEVSKEERRWAICEKRRKRKAERKDAKAWASWILFWKELTEDPDAAFAADRAEDTAYSLWRVMERGGARSRLSGWDRKLIEEHLGEEVADRLRAALIPLWRRESPPLASERDPDDRNTTYSHWILALAAIAAEAEEPGWARDFSDELAEQAIRYAPKNMNDYPAWLDDFITSHPQVVDRVLGGEISWMLAQPATQHGHSVMLQNVHHAGPRLGRLFLPRLRTWLESTQGLPRDGDDLGGAAGRLEQVVEIFRKLGDDSDRETIARLGDAALRRGSSEPFTRVWLPALFSIDPARAVARFEAMCEGIEVGRESRAVSWFAELFGRTGRSIGVNLKHPAFTGDLLLRMVRLSYRHVERDKDAVHEGSYSPDVRDNAETARNALLSAMLELGGSDGWEAKQEIARDPAFRHLRERIHTLAIQKSADEADTLAMRPQEVAKFDRKQEPGPRSPAEMFTLMTDRLEDLRDYLLEDASPRQMWSEVTDEHVMRRAIAARLEDRAIGAYSVGQENVTAEEKETDIRLLSSVNAVEGVIELKLGDKTSYSGRSLREVISEQLIKKYLAPRDRRAGCLLITRSTRQGWKHPDTGADLDFAGLMAMLKEAAKQLRDTYPGEIHIDVVGLDLERRLPTESEAREAKAAGT